MYVCMYVRTYVRMYECVCVNRYIEYNNICTYVYTYMVYLFITC